MFELGADAEAEHKKIIELSGSQNFDKIFLIGECFSKICNSTNLQICKSANLQSFSDTEKALDYFKQNPLRSNVILVKGSRGVKLERLLEIL
jgi:UDP-N-acetylmuramoyl-tripeptide--D-alanyl-D-alanine ligase